MAIEINIVTAIFNPDSAMASAYGLWQWDYGQVLRIQGLHLPSMVEIHFSLQETGGTSVMRIGVTQDGVTDVVIPDSMLQNDGAASDYNIFAFVYLTDDTSGQTEYKIKLRVKSRPEPEVFGGGENPNIFHEAVQAVKKSADKAAESEKQAEGWAHGREDLPERAEDNAKYYAEKTAGDAVQTAEDRKEVERLVESVSGIDEQVIKVENLTKQAQTSATNAALSEQAAKTAETNAQNAQAGAETAEGNAELAERNAKASEQAVEKAKQLVTQMGQEVLDNKNHVDQTAQAFALTAQQAVADVNNAGQTQTERVEGARNDAVESVKTAQTAATKAVEAAKTEAVEAVQTESTTQTRNVSAEGEKQVQAVQAAAQEIVADREQIQENKADVTTLKEDIGNQEKEINSIKDLFFEVDSKTYYDHASDEMLSQSAGNSGQIYVLNDFIETNGKLTEVEISVASDCNFKLYVFEQYDAIQVSKVKLSNVFDFNLKKGNNHILVNADIPKKVRFGITGENNSVKYGNIGNGSIHWTTTNVNNWNTIGQTGVINTGGNTGDFSVSLSGAKQTQLIKNLKGKTILLFGDSRSSSDYTWYKDLLEEKTGATVLNNGSSGASPKTMITTGYLDNMLDIKHDICIMFLCGNISGYKESIGTFSYGSPLNTWGEKVVSRWNGEEEFDVNTFNKPIQHIDYIVQKYNKKFFADRKHKLYILTDIPSKRNGEQHGYTIVCNYGKSEMIKEVCIQNGVPYIDTMTKCRFNEDFEPAYTPPTDLTTNKGVYYMDGLHLNEYGNDVLTDVIVHELLDV